MDRLINSIEIMAKTASSKLQPTIILAVADLLQDGKLEMSASDVTNKCLERKPNIPWGSRLYAICNAMRKLTRNSGGEIISEDRYHNGFTIRFSTGDISFEQNQFTEKKQTKSEVLPSKEIEIDTRYLIDDVVTEIHPFLSHIPYGYDKIIVGSFPPIKMTIKKEKNIKNNNMSFYYDAFGRKSGDSDINFFYGSDDNDFWKLLSIIFNVSTESPEQAKKLLDKFYCGIIDIYESISRKVVKESDREYINSSDSNIGLFKENPELFDLLKSGSLKVILTTSQYVTDFLISRYDKSLNGIQVITLLSPSKQGNRSIGRKPEFKELKELKAMEPFDYKLLKYKEVFGRWV